MTKAIFSILLVGIILTCSTLETLAKTVVLPAGTRIPVNVYTTVSSDNVKANDQIAVTVSKDILQEGVVVFKRGTQGVLQVHKSKPSRGHGGRGRLTINGGRVTDIQGQEHNIGVSFSSKGASKRLWAIIATIFGIVLILTPFGLWVEGEPATLQGGAQLEGILTSPVSITVPDTLPAGVTP